MSNAKVEIFEDTLRLAIADGADRLSLADALRAAGDWEEVVPGMADIAVKFDPEKMTEASALEKFQDMLKEAETLPAFKSSDAVRLTACVEGKFAPDAPMVAGKLGIAPGDLADWLDQRRYRVVMMGFQPGFAYLEDVSEDALPEISRLDTPRQRVAAGSIGCLGNRLCLYAQDGPGGWPIIGRISNRLFDLGDWENPFLLAPGQPVHFNCLPAMLFEKIRG